jgi:hypothetical protein
MLSFHESNSCRYEKLREGLAHTIVSIPWIAGDIVSFIIEIELRCPAFPRLTIPIQGPEEGSDLRNNRIQVVEGTGGVEFRFVFVLPSNL